MLDSNMVRMVTHFQATHYLTNIAANIKTYPLLGYITAKKANSTPSHSPYMSKNCWCMLVNRREVQLSLAQHYT
jgi:hypothetical protein